MKISWSYLFTLIALPTLLILMNGCGGSDAPASTTTLSKTEAEAVAGAISQSAGDVLDDDANQKLATKLVNAITSSLSASKDCQEGGDRKVTGSSNVTGTETQINGDYTVTSKFNKCGVETEDGDIIVLDGDVTLSGDIDITATSKTNVSGSFSSSASGSIDVSGDSVKEGTCGISFTAESSFQGTTVDISISGSICGRSISIDATADVGDDT